MTTRARRPGSHLRRFAERTFDRQTLDSVVLPAIADLQHECSDGLVADSRLAPLRTYWGVWKTLAFCLLLEWSRHGRTTVNGVAARLTIILPIVMVLIMVPMLIGGFGDALSPTPRLFMSLPQALMAALPIAFFFAVALERHPHSLPRLVPAVFGMAFVCSLLMMALTFSIHPRVTHAYAEATYEQSKARGRPTTVSFGPGEWTFTVLVRRARSETSQKDRSTARKMLTGRLATSTLPIVLGFAALGIAGYPRVHSVFLGTWVLMSYLAALRAAAPSSYTAPAVSGVWVVNALFALAGLCLVWLRPSPAGADRGPSGYVIS